MVELTLVWWLVNGFERFCGVFTGFLVWVHQVRTFVASDFIFGQVYSVSVFCQACLGCVAVAPCGAGRVPEGGGDGSAPESVVSSKPTRRLDRRDVLGTSRPHPVLERASSDNGGSPGRTRPTFLGFRRGGTGEMRLRARQRR